PASKQLSVCSPVFLSVRIRPSPRSTLFPSRRSSDLSENRAQLIEDEIRRTMAPFNIEGSTLKVEARSYADGFGSVGKPEPLTHRSEEHTSELQSRENLVCRLLLEKKKTCHHPACSSR